MASLVSTTTPSSQSKNNFSDVYAEDFNNFIFCCCYCFFQPDNHIYINHFGKAEPFIQKKATHGNEDAISRERIKQIVVHNLLLIQNLQQRESIFQIINANNFLLRNDEILFSDIARINKIFMTIPKP